MTTCGARLAPLVVILSLSMGGIKNFYTFILINKIFIYIKNRNPKIP